jgi:hypothetical protein
MTWRTIAAAAVLAGSWLCAPAGAQEAAAPAPKARAPEAQAPEAATVDVSKLPFNLVRLQRQLQESVARQIPGGPAIRYTIDVFAEAPRIQLFNPEYDLRFGPVPYSAPMHQDMMNLATPQEFRAPIIGFSRPLGWLKKRSKDER